MIVVKRYVGFSKNEIKPLIIILCFFFSQPYLYNTSSGIYVSYENELSYAIKGGFIYSASLKGFAIWEAGGDSNDTLLNSICKFLGFVVENTEMLIICTRLVNATQYGGPLKSKTVPISATPSSSSASLILEGAHSLWRYLPVVLLALQPWLA
jgi:chitinase